VERLHKLPTERFDEMGSKKTTDEFPTPRSLKKKRVTIDVSPLGLGGDQYEAVRAIAQGIHSLETLKSLEAAGIIASWSFTENGKPKPWKAWILTPFAVARLGLVIIEEGVEEYPRWGYPSEISKAVRVQHEPGQSPLVFAEMIQDPSPGPEFLLDPVCDMPVRLFAGTPTPEQIASWIGLVSLRDAVVKLRSDGLRGGLGDGDGTPGLKVRLARSRQSKKRGKKGRKRSRQPATI
jgi:hypothetical protein